jgi:class 3 adenylate cyclase
MQEQLKLPVSPAAASGARQTAVLFAEIAAPAGTPVADKDRLRMVETLGQAVDLSGGRIVTRREGDLMALFSTPDAAAAAAMRIHVYAEAIAQKQAGLAVRVGFHSGPVKQRGGDIFGDTVNLALLMVEKAKTGQIVTSESTAASLSPGVQERVRPLGHVKPGGAGDKLLLGELVWRKGPHEAKPAILASAPGSRSALRLAFKGAVVVRRREGDVITLGREGCDLLVAGAAASRRHCSIERRNGGFILTDHSTNGTFVAPERQPEAPVRSASLALSGRGSIGIGQSCATAGAEIVSYACE